MLRQTDRQTDRPTDRQLHEGFVCALLLALSACTATEPPGQRVETHAQAIEEERPSCTIEAPAPVVRLTATAIAQGDVDVRTDGALSVVVDNDGDESGEASIRIRSRSELGWNATTIVAGDVGAAGSRDVDLSAAVLALPRGSFDYSGSITLVADLELEGGGHAQSPAVHLFFHPTLSGWVFYDAAGRSARHDDGALNEVARTERAIALEAFGSSGLTVGRSPVRKISDSASFVPDNDVPVDDEQDL